MAEEEETVMPPSTYPVSDINFHPKQRQYRARASKMSSSSLSMTKESNPYTTPTTTTTTSLRNAITIEYQLPSQLHPPRASLLGVSCEIRLHIYSYLFQTPPPRSELNERRQVQNAYTRSRLQAIQSDHGLTPGDQVLGVCRQIYHECLPMLHRSVLLVPRLYTPSWREDSPFRHAVSETRPLPLDRTRLGRTDEVTLQRLRIQELVVRDWVQKLPSTFDADIWEREKSVVRVPLEVDTVYLQLCVCQDTNYMIPGTPGFASSRAGHVAGSIFALFLSIQKMRRVVVYYCGTKGSAHVSTETAAVFVEAMTKIFDEVVMESLNGRDVWWTETVKACPLDGKSDVVSRYIMTFPEFEGRPEGKLEVEFYNSFSETQKACVLV